MTTITVVLPNIYILKTTSLSYLFIMSKILTQQRISVFIILLKFNSEITTSRANDKKC